MTTSQKHPITTTQLQALVSPLNPSRVASRQQGRQGLSYLEAWDVKAALIRVFGFGGFSSEVLESEMLFREQVPQSNNAQKMNWKITYRVRVKLTILQTGATYTEEAIADSSQPDFTEAADMALKSAESDALKRAAIFLGTQFGLSLYNAGSTVDVVRVVLAPDQRWPVPAEATPEQQTAQQMQAIVHGQSGPPEGSSLTPEAHAEAQALVERALTMRAARETAVADDVDFNAVAQQEQGTPAVLDATLSVTRSSDPVEMDPDYGGDGGKAEGMAYEQV